MSPISKGSEGTLERLNAEIAQRDQFPKGSGLIGSGPIGA